MHKDYTVYEFSFREKWLCFFEGMALNGLVSFLFYNSLSAMIPGMLLVVFYLKEKKHMLARKRRGQMRVELKEYLNALIAALQTGRSIENAFREAFKDTARYIGKETDFLNEIKKICAGMDIGQPLEPMLMDFAVRSQLEELAYFAQVFSVGKRSGGNLIGIMKNTIHMLQERMDAEEEIATAVTEKQLEFQLMSVIPLAIIGYLRITAGTLLEHLYGNITGMSGQLPYLIERRLVSHLPAQVLLQYHLCPPAMPSGNSGAPDIL